MINTVEKVNIEIPGLIDFKGTKTPITDWMEENWPEREFLRDRACDSFDRYCVTGKILIDSPREIKRAAFISDENLRRLVHWNNRHDRTAALEAIRTWELTGELPACPGTLNVNKTIGPDQFWNLGFCEYYENNI